MSSYNRGGDRHYRDRDPRERSPSRHHGDHRSRDEPRNTRSERTEHSRGHGTYTGNRDASRGTHEKPVSSEVLRDLPNVVQIPPDVGAALRLEIQKPNGTLGREAVFTTNHFQIQSLPVIKIYQLDVRMQVPASSQRRGDAKVSAMQQTKALLKASGFLGPEFVFDGVSSGWTSRLLMPVGETRTTMIDLEGHSSAHPNQVEVAVRNSGRLNIRELVDYLKKGHSGIMSHGSPAVRDCFNALNSIYRHDPAARFIARRNSSAFFVRARGLTSTLQSTGGILEALRGLFQAISYTFGALSLNVDVITSAFYVPDICMVDVAKAFAGITPYQSIDTVGRSAMFLEACERMTGIFFTVRHLDSTKNSKKLRVQRLSPGGAQGTTFDEKDHATGKVLPTTVADYFRRKYGIKLRYPELPLLKTKDGEFPMELCFTAPGERYKAPLEGKETSDFIKFATSPAYVRHQQIMENVKRLHWHELAIPKSMGLSVSTSMLQVLGRILPCPIPQYGSGIDSEAPRSGQWNLRNKRFLKAEGFKSWGVLYLPGGHRHLDEKDVMSFARAITISFGTVGMKTPEKPPSMLKGNPQGSLKEEVSNLLGKTGNSFGRKPEIFLFLLHEHANPAIYKALKNICEVQHGIPSQVMIVEKALQSKGQQQYLGNISLKVNCKLGGTNSAINEPLFRRTRFMLLGGDSSHPSAAQLRQLPPPPSFGALVASYDTTCATYTAVASAQAATTELMETFSPMFKELMSRYQKKNGKFPQAIIYFRDGIGESQIPEFKATECKALKEVCQSTGQDIKLTVINCVKRHHTRLFPPNGQGDKLGNVLPGTVVEASQDKDIFLVSQAALQGTVRPCRYSVILDENNLSHDDFQRLVFGGTFSYGRATRSVSIHPAVYYADQVAQRAKMHLRESDGVTTLHDVHPDLVYTMYWQ